MPPDGRKQILRNVLEQGQIKAFIDADYSSIREGLSEPKQHFLRPCFQPLHKSACLDFTSPKWRSLHSDLKAFSFNEKIKCQVGQTLQFTTPSWPRTFSRKMAFLFSACFPDLKASENIWVSNTKPWIPRISFVKLSLSHKATFSPAS